MRRTVLVLLALVLTLAVGACGSDSSSGGGGSTTTAPPQTTSTSAAGNDALTQVCDARADVSKQVDTLRGLSPNVSAVPQATAALQAIRDDLKTMKDAQPSLSADRRSEVEAATKQFEQQVTSVANDLTSNLTKGDIKSTLTTAADDLASGVKDAFSRVDCPSG